MSWTEDEIRAEIASPEWGTKVLEALRTYFNEGRPLLEAAKLLDSKIEAEPDGTPVLKAVYVHPYEDRRIGLRRRLTQFPLTIPAGATPAEGMAETIALYEISEPLGRYSEILVNDGEGVWWWGDGFPDLTEDPDRPWYADLPWGSWQRLTEQWTVATTNERVCSSVAIAADQASDSRGTVLFPPHQVRCVRPEGHSGIHISESRSKQPDGLDTEVFGWA